MQLYKLSNELACILGEADDEISEDLESRLNALTLAFEQKGESILQYRQSLIADADAIKSEVERLQARADGLQRKATWMKDYLHRSMEQVGIAKLTTLTFSATIAKSSPKCELADGAEIPEAYTRLVPESKEFDKKKAIDDWKAKKDLPASVTVTQGTNLRIS